MRQVAASSLDSEWLLAICFVVLPMEQQDGENGIIKTGIDS